VKIRQLDPHSTVTLLEPPPPLGQTLRKALPECEVPKMIETFASSRVIVEPETVKSLSQVPLGYTETFR